MKIVSCGDDVQTFFLLICIYRYIQINVQGSLQVLHSEVIRSRGVRTDGNWHRNRSQQGRKTASCAFRFQ